MRGVLSLLFVAVCLSAGQASAATLERIKQSGVIKVAFRADAPPYSFKNDVGEASGYTVDLCRAVASSLKTELDLKSVSIEYIPVTTQDRFTAIQEGRADMLCGATTATLSRRALVDFSVPTFIDGASVLFQAQGPDNFEKLAGHKIGVRSGTTTEDALNVTLERMGLNAEVVAVSSHDEGVAKLQANEVSAYFADQAILYFLMAKSPGRGELRLSNRFFTHEPYAIGLPRGDSEFRLAVDRALSRVYRGGAIKEIFTRNFGDAKASDLVKALYLVSALPE